MKGSSKPAAKKASSKSQPVAKAPKQEAPSKAMPPKPAQPPEASPIALVRDRYTMPEPDYALLAVLKKRARAAGRPTKKNELLRAGLHALRDSGSAELKRILERLIPVPRTKKR